MKYLFLSLLLLTGVYGCDQPAGIVKSAAFYPSEKPKQRYFFIVYNYSLDSIEGSGNIGWVTHDGNYPSHKMIDDSIACWNNFSPKEVLVTNILEFKDSADYNSFWNNFPNLSKKCQ